MDRPHLFIHSLIDGHLCCFHFLPSMNSAAMNVCVQDLCGHVFIFLEHMFSTGTAGSYSLGHILIPKVL